MTVPRIPAARIVFSAEDRRDILRMIDQSLQDGSLTLGPRTREFEEAFALRLDAPHAIAVSSGTSALEIILRTLAVEGREVVVPTNTFFATAAAVVHAGGTPRLADVSSRTLALSAETLETALTPLTAVVVLVHIGGSVTPDVDAIRSICDRRGIVLVEDAAHAHGASFEGRAAGTFGHAAAFSFYPTKVMTSGEGGMITTGDETLRDEAILYRDQGKAGFLGGDHVRMGYAWRMSELHAAVGLTHLSHLDEAMATRGRVAARYDEALADLSGCRPLSIPRTAVSNFYKYVVLLDPGIDRVRLKREMSERTGVSLSGEVYASPLHRQPIFADLDRNSFPVAEDVCARHICLPVHSDMTDDEADYVVESLASVLDGRAMEEAVNFVRVCVTGGSGFIGSHVVDYLAAGGHEVVVIDVRAPHRPDVGYFHADVTDLPKLVKATAGSDAVFHLAAVANVNDAYADPVATTEINVAGTSRVCEAARHNGLGRIILASTVWVYSAAAGDGPLREDTPLASTGSEHIYTASKVAAELVVSSFGELYGLPYTVLRYGIPFGPRMRQELAIPQFLHRARNGEKITIHGDGLQFRNYIYVEDLAEAHVLALGEAGANQIFNLEGPAPVSIRHAAELACELMGPLTEIEFTPARPGDYAGRATSVDKADRMLGWAPRTSFDEGMRRYVEWLAEEDSIEQIS